MIFQHTWEKVLSGEKTQTRRIYKRGEFTNCWYDDMIINEVLIPQTKVDKYGMTMPRNVYLVGKTYAVQPGRGKRSVFWKHDENGVLINTVDLAATYVHWTRKSLIEHGWHEMRVEILRIWVGDVRKISELDARAEGFTDKMAFLETWVKMHDHTRQFYREGYLYRQWRGIPRKWEVGSENSVVDCLNTRPADRYQAWVLDFCLTDAPQSATIQGR